MKIRDRCSHCDFGPTIQIFLPMLVLHLTHFFLNPNLKADARAICKWFYIVTNGYFHVFLRARWRNADSPVDGRIAWHAVPWLKNNPINIYAWLIRLFPVKSASTTVCKYFCVNIFCINNRMKNVFRWSIRRSKIININCFLSEVWS